MKPAKILATGLLFFLIFMPVFSFTGDLRIECEVTSSSNNCNEYGYMQGIAGAGMMFGILLSVGGSYKLRGNNSGRKGSDSGLWYAYEGDGKTNRPEENNYSDVKDDISVPSRTLE